MLQGDTPDGPVVRGVQPQKFVDAVGPGIIRKKDKAEARARIAGIAAAAGLTALPSATNFVAIDCGGDGEFARAVLKHLIEQGIFVRMPFVAPQDRCIRVSAGTPADIDAFAEALPTALDRARAQT